MFDVLVIGAGLAGLHCARLLGERGLRVGLIDRKRSVTDNVQTTGIFVRKTWEDFALPAEQFGAPIRRVTLYSPARRAMTLEADRDEFRVGRMPWIYLWLLEQCHRAGVLWMPDTRVIGIEWTGEGASPPLDTTVITERGRIAARFVIGADGARSIVARELGLDRNREMLVGLEEIVESRGGEPQLHCYLDPRLAPGYIAWLCDDGEEAHLGVAGYRGAFDPAASLLRLRESIGEKRRSIERRGGLIPVGGILRRIASERGLLIGDAAGAVSPLTAGGLDAALRLSQFAAGVAASFIETGDRRVLRDYTGDAFRARFFARRWMRRLMRSASNVPMMELACAMLRTAPLRALAAHVFFARGSFPDPPPLRSLAFRT
jgi:flavin-dependent dehydrogenase